jgi:hypothetical protein
MSYDLSLKTEKIDDSGGVTLYTRAISTILGWNVHCFIFMIPVHLSPRIYDFYWK